jgi:hypothetical protein
LLVALISAGLADREGANRMTFYNVLSALLFLGAVRVLLVSIDSSNWSDAAATGSLVVLVFNDMLSTSHDVESREDIRYTLPLMLIDLWNFLLLAVAMIVISPKKNLFDVELHRISSALGAHSYWLLLALYWVSLMVWTAIAERQRNGQVWNAVLWQGSVVAVLLIEWVLSVVGTRVAICGGPITLAYLVLYLVWLRPSLRAEALPPAPADPNPRP